MSLKFYPFLDYRDRKQIEGQKQAGETLIISLIDLKPQQLPMNQRSFVIDKDNNLTIDKKIGEVKQTKKQVVSQSEQEVIYSNIESMLWISQPIKMTNIYLVDDHSSGLPPNQSLFSNQLSPIDKSQVSVRYLYLPPVSEYMKHFTLKLKKQDYLSNYSSSNTQLPHYAQLTIEERHQMMYCLSRELSSAVVYQFGSKYIRFDHNTWKDYRHSVFGITEKVSDKKTQQNRMKQKQQQAPYYVVIKSSSYSSQRDYQVYKVKLSYNQQSPLSSRSQSNACFSQSNNQMSSMSMEIESKSIIPIRKKPLKEESNNTYLTEKEKIMKEMEEISDKLLQLKQNAIQINEFVKNSPINLNSNNYNQETIPTETQSQKVPEGHNQAEKQREVKQYEKKCQQNPINRELMVRRSFVPYTIPLDYRFLISLIQEYIWSDDNIQQKLTLPQQKVLYTKSAICLSKSKIDNLLQYYRTCTQIKHKLVQMHKKQPRDQKDQLKTSDLSNEMLQLFTKIFIYSNQAQLKPESESSEFSKKQQLKSFQVIEQLQNLIVKHLVKEYQLGCCFTVNKQRIHNQQRLKLSKLINRIGMSWTELNLFQSQVNVILSLHHKLKSFIQQNIISLMQNQTQSFIQLHIAPIHHQPIIQSSSKPPLSPPSDPLSNYTSIPTLNILILTELKLNYSNQLYSHLNNKLSSHDLPFPEYFPIIFSHPLQTQHLKTTITQKDSQIHNINQQIALLEIQLAQKQSLIEDQERKISKYKLDEVFYQQVMNELNSTQSSLSSETQTKKKLTIDLQCSKILNMQANQTIEQFKLKQSRLLEQKQNFLQAISHLSKQNQHYITLTQQLQSTIESLNHKMQSYKLIDMEIDNLKTKNHELTEENQSIKTWRKTVEQQHKHLLKLQTTKFNFILQLNQEKYQEKTLTIEKMKHFILELTEQLDTQSKQSALLQQEINYLKKRYFNPTHLHIDYSINDNEEDPQSLSNPPSHYLNHSSFPLQTR